MLISNQASYIYFLYRNEYWVLLLHLLLQLNLLMVKIPTAAFWIESSMMKCSLGCGYVWENIRTCPRVAVQWRISDAATCIVLRWVRSVMKCSKGREVAGRHNALRIWPIPVSTFGTAALAMKSPPSYLLLNPPPLCGNNHLVLCVLTCLNS